MKGSSLASLASRRGARRVDPLEITAETDDATTDRTVKGLAWKLLYGNHRPSLGPDPWDEVVDQVGGPDDVKELALDQELAAGPFESALWALDNELGEGDGSWLSEAGRAAAERWSTMYQRLTDHLDRRPEQMIELVCSEIHPWFFPDDKIELAAIGASSATVRIESSLPAPFLEGWLAGFVELTGAKARAVAHEDPVVRLEFTPVEPEGPSTAVLLLEATRARLLPATLAPVLLGSAYAAAQGSFGLGPFLVALTGAVLLHLSFNLLNDVLDHRQGIDEANLTPTPFSGGSRVIQRGLLGSDAMLGLAVGLGLAGSALGITSALSAGWPVLVLGLLGVGIGYAYSGAPFRLADRGLGEVAAALVFGPLVTSGAAAVQSTSAWLPALAVGLPLGASMAAFWMVKELPDAPWDARTGRRTLVVRLGEAADTGTAIALLSPYPLVAVLVGAGLVPTAAIVGLAVLPFAAFVALRVLEADRDTDQLARIQGLTLLLHGTLGLALAAGLAWGVLA